MKNGEPAICRTSFAHDQLRRLGWREREIRMIARAAGDEHDADRRDHVAVEVVVVEAVVHDVVPVMLCD